MLDASHSGASIVVDIATAVLGLTEENQRLSNRIAALNEYIQKMNSMSLADYGFSGSAAKALEQNIKRRPELLQAQICVFEAIWNANCENLALLEELKAQSGLDLIDTSVFYAQKTTAQTKKQECFNLQEAFRNFETFCTGVPVSSYNFIDSLISAQNAIILECDKKIQATYNYIEASNTLYKKAIELSENILQKSIQTMKDYTATNKYDPSAWIDLLAEQSCNNAQYVLNIAAPYLDPKEYEALSLALQDGGIDALEIYAPDTDTFNDTLVTALVKIPVSLVSDDTVNALAEAYYSMHTGGSVDNFYFDASDINQSAIERFYECMYIYDKSFLSEKLLQLQVMIIHDLMLLILTVHRTIVIISLNNQSCWAE